MTPTEIETRIHAAIRPQLDECDRLLDYYTEGLPREVWLSIAEQLMPNPKKHRNTIDAVIQVLDQILDDMKRPLTRDDLTEVGP